MKEQRKILKRRLESVVTQKFEKQCDELNEISV
jgi:hypothetical protein